MHARMHAHTHTTLSCAGHTIPHDYNDRIVVVDQCQEINFVKKLLIQITLYIINFIRIHTFIIIIQAMLSVISEGRIVLSTRACLRERTGFWTNLHLIVGIVDP